MPDIENMQIWESLCKTPTEFLTEYQRENETALTAINPEYRIMRMTEQFGAVGYGWGWTLHEYFDKTWGSVSVVYAVVSIWYESVAGKAETGKQIGGTVIGAYPDNAYKSAITDAIGKCLASLGVGADVYLRQAELPTGARAGRQGSPAPSMDTVPNFGNSGKVEPVPQKKEEPVKQPDPPQPAPPSPPTPPPSPSQSPTPAEQAVESGRPVCPHCGSDRTSKGRGKPNHCFGCDQSF